MFLPLFSLAQTKDISGFSPAPVKVQAYSPYLAVRHGGPSELEKWKAANPAQYRKEIWYFTESFSIVKGHQQEGIELPEGMLDITRFEHARLAERDTVLLLPGFRDGLKLLAADKLLYFPDYAKK